MKIDFKNPIISSLFSIIITFVISVIVLFITKPLYIIDVSEDGTKKTNIALLLSVCMLFAVLVGITVFLLKTGDSLKPPEINHVREFNPMNYNTYSPTY